MKKTNMVDWFSKEPDVRTSSSLALRILEKFPNENRDILYEMFDDYIKEYLCTHQGYEDLSYDLKLDDGTPIGLDKKEKILRAHFSKELLRLSGHKDYDSKSLDGWISTESFEWAYFAVMFSFLDILSKYVDFRVDRRGYGEFIKSNFKMVLETPLFMGDVVYGWVVINT